MASSAFRGLIFPLTNCSWSVDDVCGVSSTKYPKVRIAGRCSEKCSSIGSTAAVSRDTARPDLVTARKPEQAVEKVFTACFPLCSLPRRRERTEGRKPAFSQGVEADALTNAMGILSQHP